MARRPSLLFVVAGLAALLGATGCSGSSEPVRPDTRTYGTEVLPTSLLSAYGTWDFHGATSGWGDSPADVDRLRLFPYGRFECLIGGEVVLTGAITVATAEGGTTVVFGPDGPEDLVRWPDVGSPLFVYESRAIHPLTLRVPEDGATLWLKSGIDAPVYHFTRAP